MKSLLVPLDASSTSGVQSSDRNHQRPPETKICGNQTRLRADSGRTVPPGRAIESTAGTLPPAEERQAAKSSACACARVRSGCTSPRNSTFKTVSGRSTYVGLGGIRKFWVGQTRLVQKAGVEAAVACGGHEVREHRVGSQHKARCCTQKGEHSDGTFNQRRNHLFVRDLPC